MFGRKARKPSAPAPDSASPEAAGPNRDAIAALYDRFAPRVHAYALQRLHDPDLAADITNTTFARALSALMSFEYRDDAAAEGWLLAIARNAIIDHVRANRRLTVLDADTCRQHLHATSPDPASAAVAPDERERLLDALAKLTVTQQRIVLLRVQGWNGVEIAALLDMSHGAVRAAQHRAYARLRDLLAADAAFATDLSSEPDHA